MGNDLIDRQAAIDAIERIFDRCEEIEAHLPEGDPDRVGYKMYPDWLTVWKYLHQLPSAPPDLDSAYTEGYTAAESKYRKMWDEMQYEQQDRLREITKNEYDEWCTDCKEYDKKRNSCPRWNRVIRETLKDMKEAQPEIIRCKDCKHSEHWYGDKRRCFLWHETGIDVFEDGYCNYAERKDNG